MRTILIYLLVALQFADVATTNIGITLPGRREGNPMMAWAQSALGENWWLIKIGLACIGILVLSRLRPRWPLNMAAGSYSILVVQNVMHVGLY